VCPGTGKGSRESRARDRRVARSREFDGSCCDACGGKAVRGSAYRGRRERRVALAKPRKRGLSPGIAAEREKRPVERAPNGGWSLREAATWAFATGLRARRCQGLRG